MSMPDKPFVFMAKNAVVAEFKALVENAINKNSGSSNLKNIISGNLHNKNEALLDKELHDKACSLPEAKTVSLKKQTKDSTYQYGTFTGDKVYSDWNGTIKKNSNDATKLKGTSGWVSNNLRTPKYLYFTSNGNSAIIDVTDFELADIVEDFQPLYDKLREIQHTNNESVVNDTKNAMAKAVTNKVTSSTEINSDSDKQDEIASNQAEKEAITGEQTKDESANDNSYKFFGAVYPKQICAKNDFSKINDSVYNNVQAVIYDMPNFQLGDNSSDDTNTGLDSSATRLLCYQQPESISYTSSAQYDAVSPRGSQQPYQFYNNANAMSLGFTLKWHIDEIRTLANSEGKSYGIQDIAQIAEDFTRPWELNNSLRPKLCKVILPGISHIGYITEAQISYSGDMSGDYTTGGGVMTGDGQINGEVKYNYGYGCIYNYFYSMIEVTFSMLIVKDITLKPGNKADKNPMTVSSDSETVTNKNNTNTETANQPVGESVSTASSITNPVEAESTKGNSANALDLNESLSNEYRLVVNEGDSTYPDGAIICKGIGENSDLIYEGTNNIISVDDVDYKVYKNHLFGDTYSYAYIGSNGDMIDIQDESLIKNKPIDFSDTEAEWLDDDGNYHIGSKLYTHTDENVDGYTIYAYTNPDTSKIEDIIYIDGDGVLHHGELFGDSLGDGYFFNS